MLVAPSLLAADFANLHGELDMLNASASDYIHIDVMDGMFVPNISIGFPVMKSIAPLADKPLDVHMMVVEPDRFINQVRECGAYLMNVHYEACRHLNRTLQLIKDAGMKCGVTLNPATPVGMLEDVIEDVDLVLIMSVNPGFGGQKFIGESIKKVARLRKLIDSTESKALIEVDGGVTSETGKALAQAGADILVAGSYIFKADNPHEAINSLKTLF